MAAIINAAYNAYRHIFYDLRDTRSDDWFLMNSVWAPLSIIAFYLYFVLSVGPRLMKNRPPMKLDTVIKIYNITQVILCIYITERSLTLGWARKYRWFCEPVDYSNTLDAYLVMKAVYSYLLVKLFDLLDTVFFVLRKKDKQVSFLHVYHHAGIFFGTWIIMKFLPGGHGTFLGTINSIVHVVMYTYYFVTNTWPEHKNNIWWKKYVTQLQMAQFLLVALHAAPVLFIKNCNYPRTIAGLMAFQYSFMFLLFWDFYKKAYRKKTE
ncbi:elongation of very long chain fatty acids protein 1 [Cryptotermes secundus]|uniref:elongation of very long chain fatty acids protein 1 n=1 Tax=Cryptotermes secundus TaxID=105785 RepID=UPI000CD7CB72|nr:elongation of very long chain fatty acids protein 1 [Cryptotermes secundus]